MWSSAVRGPPDWGRGMTCRAWAGRVFQAGRSLTALVLIVLATCLASPATAAESPAADARARLGQGDVTCSSPDASPGDQRIPLRFVSLARRGAYAVDVTAVRGWTVTRIVVQGDGGTHNVYRPGSLGLSGSAPWRALRAPLDPAGGLQAISGGFGCGSPSRLSPDPTSTACAGLRADRRSFSYVVGGRTFQYAGYIAFPSAMTTVVVAADPDLVIPDGCEIPFSLASYETRGPTWELSGQQRFLDHATASIDSVHRSITLTVQSPSCFGQTDLYLGRRIYDGGSGPGHGPLPDHDGGVWVPRGLVGAWNGSLDCVGSSPPASTPPAPATVSGSSTTTVISTTITRRPPGTDVLGDKNEASGDDSSVLAASGAGTSPYQVVPVGILLVVLGWRLVRSVAAAPAPFSPVQSSRPAGAPR